jgi:S1-C subfamily serine protease
MYAPGDKIKVEVLRDGVTQTFYVTLRNLEGNTMAVKPQTPKKSLPEFGAVLTPVPEIERQALGIQGGAKVAELYEGGILAQMGVPEGFIITKINRQKIRTPSDVHKAFETASRIVYIEGFRPSGRRATYLYDKAE